MHIQFIALAFGVLVLLGCNSERVPIEKSDATEDNKTPSIRNQNAVTLSVSVADKEVVEGAYLLYDLNLSEAISNTLLLKVAFSTSGYTSDYANPEDYSASIECSTDGGQTWISETNKTTFRLLPSALSYKIRVATTDDRAKEVLLERLSIVLSTANYSEGNRINFTPTILKGVIQDNDVSQDLRERLFLNQGADANDPRRYFMVLTDEHGTGVFTTFAVAVEVNSKKQKEIVDGEYAKASGLLNAIIKETANLPAAEPFRNIYQLQIGYTGVVSRSATLAAVTDEGGLWSMYLDLTHAYKHFTSGRDQSFNADGLLSTTIAHELGHILTLSQGTILSHDGGPCGQILVKATGGVPSFCFGNESHAVRFLNTFYRLTNGNVSAGSLPNPNFVTRYAQTNYSEDLAESFAGYVYQDEMPAGSGRNTYLDKMTFFSNRTGLGLRNAIRKVITGAGYSFRNRDRDENGVARAYVFNDRGHRSCVLVTNR